MIVQDAAIAAAIDELDRLRTRPDAWQIPLVEGQLLHQIALSTQAKLIVEVGTSYGFSGLFWGAALKRTGGHLHTIDKDPKKYDSSKLTFARCGLNERITNHLGDAHDVLPRLPGNIDIAFIDADKPACRAYFDILWPKLRPGGCILTDNVTSHRANMQEYLDFIRAREDASSVEVAIGNGVEWTIKV